MKQIIDYELKGKTCLITGGSRGIGRSIALALARQGVKVGIISRNITKLNEVVKQIEYEGGTAIALAADISKEEEIREAISIAIKRLESIDIFVNNAGITALKKFIDTTSEEVNALINTNLKGSIFCLQQISHHMINNKRGGSIIAITSVNGLQPLVSQAVYSCTKAALESLVKCLASDLGVYGIRVNSVAPGAIFTDMNHHLTPEIIESLNAKIALQKIGEPEDIADVVCFLASDQARYITGATIISDGGYLVHR